ncbi:hypothetical protein MMC17_006865 [Xylographa soralifera]|nr:hypothetical protein [Xylographa soralifera]MCJ1383751.1 hypothetical protein [Xylographa soralifera]
MLELQPTSKSNYSIPATDYAYSEDPELTCDLKGDPEIAENWATLALKIREAASTYLDCIDRKILRQPRFTSIEKYYPDLCILYRTLFGCAGVEPLSIEVKNIARDECLGCLNTFRALIACGVTEWVFHTPLQNRYFEECRQRGIYNERRISRALPDDPDFQAQIEKDVASYPFFRKEEIKQRAYELSDRMENALQGLVLPEHSDGYYVTSLPPKDLQVFLATLKQVFEKSIALKVELWRKGGVVDYIWAVPSTDETENWDPRLMELEHDYSKGHRGEVAMCLHPAVQVTQSASVRGLSGREDERETVVLGKGLVILRS